MRAFIAIKIPEKIKDKIIELQEKFKFHNVKWVEKENLHLTLKFLGEISDKNPICEKIEKIINIEKKFEIELQGIGGFPEKNHCKVIWIGVKTGNEKLAELMTKLDNELSKIGIKKEEREPVPHLTIGRVKSGTVKLFDENFSSEKFQVESIFLIKSTLTNKGPIYEDIKEFKL